MVHHPRKRRRRPWPWIVLACLWLDFLVLGIGVGMISERVSLVWMEAGPVRPTLNHPPIRGQPAQERNERYWLFGHGFYADHSMTVTTLDFSAPTSQINGNALAWVVAEEQIRDYLPTISRNQLGPQIKLSGWLLVHLLALATIFGLVGARLWVFVSKACQNRPAS